MQTLKNLSINVIKSLPENTTLEEIMYQIHLMAQVLEGFKDEEKGKLISTTELLKRIQQWRQR
ncbi:MAG: hypothetical protein HY738_20585 [Bacteroidia bacterium]|nr:hypothetical protein [Bacteroidia bacterium]